jgi:cystathionine beta-lyase
MLHFLENRPHSYKWGTYPQGTIPLWVADLDIAPPDFIKDRLQVWLDERDCAYTLVPAEFKKQIVSWYQKRHGVLVKEEWIVPLSGVVAGLHTAMMALGEPGKDFLTLTPVYPLFFNTGRQAKMNPVSIELRLTDGKYEIDFDGLERAASKASVILLSHPHNPTGRNWTKDELKKIQQIAEKWNLSIISDEIWSDWNLNDELFIPFFSLGEEIWKRTIVISAASKTFNIPGLGAAYAIIPDAKLRQKMMEAIGGILPSPILTGLLSTAIAYEKGEPWLKEAKSYILENRNWLIPKLRELIPGIEIYPGECSYLLWMDLRKSIWGESAFSTWLQKAKVVLSEGEKFGAGGKGFLRLNLGTKRENLEEAFKRIKTIL